MPRFAGRSVGSANVPRRLPKPPGRCSALCAVLSLSFSAYYPSPAIPDSSTVRSRVPPRLPSSYAHPGRPSARPCGGSGSTGSTRVSRVLPRARRPRSPALCTRSGQNLSRPPQYRPCSTNKQSERLLRESLAQLRAGELRRCGRCGQRAVASRLLLRCLRHHAHLHARCSTALHLPPSASSKKAATWPSRRPRPSPRRWAAAARRRLLWPAPALPPPSSLPPAPAPRWPASARWGRRWTPACAAPPTRRPAKR